MFCDQGPLVEAGLARSVVEEVAFRTPGFATFQHEEWQVCHDDACAFVGTLSPESLAALPQETKDVHHLSADILEADVLAVFGFRCLHCGETTVWLDYY